VLCLGRRDRTKNTDFLVRAFYSLSIRSPWNGPAASCSRDRRPARPGRHAGVTDGPRLVTEAEKTWLLANCERWRNSPTYLLADGHGKRGCTTSRHRAFGILAHQASPSIPRRRLDRVSIDRGGGLICSAYSRTQRLASSRRAPGRGQTYARETARLGQGNRPIRTMRWISGRPAPRPGEHTNTRASVPSTSPSKPAYWGRDLEPGDVHFREALREQGTARRSSSAPRRCDDRPGEAVRTGKRSGRGRRAVPSLDRDALTPHAIRHRGRKGAMYTTSPRLRSRALGSPFAKLLGNRAPPDLQRLASAFPISWGDSAYNAGKSSCMRDSAIPWCCRSFVDPFALGATAEYRPG